jgi:ubiquitin-hydrolase Zn-finger-containing protein
VIVNCQHTDKLDAPGWSEPAPDTTEGCYDCLAAGENVWAHLRMCLDCGHVACCDSSPHRHATAHAHAEGHPVIRSFEPGESWRWCYLDECLV